MANDFSSMEQEISGTEGALQASPSAYDPSMTPSGSDIALQKRLISQKSALDAAQGKEAKAEWYGNQASADGPSDTEPGFLERGLAALQAPLKAEVGAVKWLSGKAEPGQGFLEAIGQNMGRNGETFGQYLESIGAPHAVSMPVGLALDIGLDPLNWMTGGASTLVGRTGYGLVKGGLEGAALGAGSRGLEMASGLARFVPGLKASGEKATEEVAALAKILKTGDEAKLGLAKTAGIAGPMRTLQANVVNLGEKARAMRAAYNEKVGYDLMGELNRVAEHGAWGLKPSAMLEDFIRKVTPNGKGDDIIKFMKFSSTDWDKHQKFIGELKSKFLEPLGWRLSEGGWASSEKNIEQAAKDMAEAAQKSGGVMRMSGAPGDVAAAQKRLEMLETVHPDPSRAALGEDVESLARQYQDVPYEGKPISVAYSNAAMSGSELLSGGSVAIPRNEEELMDFFQKVGLEGEAVDSAKAMLMAAKEQGRTGSVALDAAMAKLHSSVQKAIGVKATKVVDKAVAYMDVMNKLFTVGKTALNPGTWVNNFISGHVMAAMAGVDIMNPEYMKIYKGAVDTFRGIKDNYLFKQLAPHLGGIQELASGSSGDWVRRSLDIDLNAFSDEALISKALKEAQTSGTKVSADDILKTLEELSAKVETAKAEAASAGSLEKEADIAKRVIDVEKKKRFVPAKSAIERIANAEGGAQFGKLNAQDLPNSFFLSEVAHGSFADFLNVLDAQARSGNGAAKVLYTTLTKPATWYGDIDKAQKLATFSYAVSHGLTEEGLKVANRMIGMGEKGVAGTKIVGGETRYLLTPEAAVSFANEAGTNYAAMPQFVQLMRSIPVIGSPFVAFPYAMSAKLAKTLAYNPSFFNKVAFAMQEVGGRKSPLEKQAINGADGSPGYYSFLQGPGFLRIPYFKDHPIYLNMTNWLPYYSLNMLMPSDRSYRDTWAGKVTDAIDHSPLFKGPWGQALVDYVLLPHLLSEGETAQGYFGQQLYPENATGVEKAGYAARSLTEAYMPGFLGLTGALNPLMPEALQSEEAIQKVPMYRYRALANAAQGKNPLGIPSKSATLGRGILSALGLPTTPVDLTNQNQ